MRWGAVGGQNHKIPKITNPVTASEINSAALNANRRTRAPQMNPLDSTPSRISPNGPESAPGDPSVGARKHKKRFPARQFYIKRIRGFPPRTQNSNSGKLR